MLQGSQFSIPETLGLCAPGFCSYCRNLPASYTRQDIGEMFVPFGTVLEIRL